MRRQAFPPHIKVAGPTSAPPQRFGLSDSGNTVVVNHYSNADKLIPAIPGFKTSAGMFVFSFVAKTLQHLFWSCALVGAEKQRLDGWIRERAIVLAHANSAQNETLPDIMSLFAENISFHSK